MPAAHEVTNGPGVELLGSQADCPERTDPEEGAGFTAQGPQRAHQPAPSTGCWEGKGRALPRSRAQGLTKSPRVLVASPAVSGMVLVTECYCHAITPFH